MDGNDIIYGGPGDDSPLWAEGARTSSTGGWQRFLGRILGPGAAGQALLR
jgi:hypothetical protein